MLEESWETQAEFAKLDPGRQRPSSCHNVCIRIGPVFEEQGKESEVQARDEGSFAGFFELRVTGVRKTLPDSEIPESRQ